MTDLERYDDPYFMPPADIQGAEAKAYEEKIVSILREYLLPSPGPARVIESIELRGERPATEIIFHYTRWDRPGRHAVHARLWQEEWPFDDDDRVELNEANETAKRIFDAWMSSRLKPVEIDTATDA